MLMVAHGWERGPFDNSDLILTACETIRACGHRFETATFAALSLLAIVSVSEASTLMALILRSSEQCLEVAAKLQHADGLLDEGGVCFFRPADSGAA